MARRNAVFASGITLVILLAVASAQDVFADDFFRHPYETRLFLALDRQNNHSATLGRQASLAVLEGASANPAAAGWSTIDTTSSIFTASYVGSTAASGNRLAAAPIAARWYLASQTSASFAYAHSATTDTRANDGLQHDLSSNEFFGAFSTKLAADLSLGVVGRFTSGRLARTFHEPALAAQTIRTDNRFKGPDVSVGIAGTGARDTSYGLVASLGRSWVESDIRAVGTVFLPSPEGGVIAVPNDAELGRASDQLRNVALRGGGGLALAHGSAIYADVSWTRIRSNLSGPTALVRCAVGLERSLTDDASVRTGVTVDATGAVTLSAGGTYRPARDVELLFAWQHNAAPEIRP